jgi:hypothetical protein
MAHMLSAILRPANGNNRRAWRSKGKAPSLLNVGGNERRRSTKGPRVDQDMRPKGSSEGPPFCAPRAHSPTVRRRSPLLAGGIIGSTSLGVRQDPDNAGYFNPLPGGVRVSTSVPPKKIMRLTRGAANFSRPPCHALSSRLAALSASALIVPEAKPSSGAFACGRRIHGCTSTGKRASCAAIMPSSAICARKALISWSAVAVKDPASDAASTGSAVRPI